MRFRGKVHYVMRVEAGNQGVHSCTVGDVGDGELIRRHHTIEIGAVARVGQSVDNMHIGSGTDKHAHKSGTDESGTAGNKKAASADNVSHCLVPV